MKKAGKIKLFILLILVFSFAYFSFFGLKSYYGDSETVYFKSASDIRWGIDISGGVEATFTPDYNTVKKENVTAEHMESAKKTIDTRLIYNNVTDYEIYADAKSQQVTVRFPWKSGETEFNPQEAVKELGETAILTFREGDNQTKDANPEILVASQHVKKAEALYHQKDPRDSTSYAGWVVSLELTPSGTSKFAEATGRLVNQKISIWMDDAMISAPTVNSKIENGSAVINGMANAEEAKDLASKINAGALPFKLICDDSSLNVITSTMGERALDAMLMAAAIAFGLVCLLMIIHLRLPGFVACISLLGQVAGMVATTSGFFGSFNSFTLTLPGIAGIILSIGMGVDANVITAARIKDELAGGKTLDGAIDAVYQEGFSAILDGNAAVIIVAVVLMGAFGPPDNMAAQIISPLFFMFGGSIAGSIYSFGYTLLMGVIFNFVFGVTASRLMTKGFSRFNPLRKLGLYGGVKA